MRDFGARCTGIEPVTLGSRDMLKLECQRLGLRTPRSKR